MYNIEEINRIKPALAAAALLLLFWLPLWYWVRALPYDFIKHEYRPWLAALKECALAVWRGPA